MLNFNKKIEFIIFAYDYDESIGGTVVLHYLCHMLNKLGAKAYLMPAFNSYTINFLSWAQEVQESIVERYRISTLRLKTNENWDTPIYPERLDEISLKENVVAIYPEIIFGNPLKAKNVTRWLLHHPGFHTKDAYYTANEVQFRFEDWIKPLNLPWLEISKNNLNVIAVPWDKYYIKEDGHARTGTAYAIRKGKNKKISHDIRNSILIDDKPHEEVAKIFKSVKQFISYDTKTFYSSLALLSGCESIVIPDDNVTIDEWDSSGIGRLGIAYGWDDLKRAKATKNERINLLKESESKSVESIKEFMNFWNNRLV